MICVLKIAFNGDIIVCLFSTNQYYVFSKKKKKTDSSFPKIENKTTNENDVIIVAKLLKNCMKREREKKKTLSYN